LVQALLNISENASRVLSVIKAKYGLKDKSAAVEHLVSRYIDESEDRELKPEFIEKLKKIEKRGKFVQVDDFAKHYGLKDVHSKS
jgi:hypothetical protein